ILVGLLGVLDLLAYLFGRFASQIYLVGPLGGCEGRPERRVFRFRFALVRDVIGEYRPGDQQCGEAEDAYNHLSTSSRITGLPPMTKTSQRPREIAGIGRVRRARDLASLFPCWRNTNPL